MRLSQASRKKKFEHLLSTLPQPIAELAAEVAAVPSSRTSMTTLATALVHFMLQDFQERYAGAADYPEQVMLDYVSDMKGDIMEVVDWAASVGDAWKSESSFAGMLGRSREWHEALAENADDTIQYPTEDETVADLGNGWRIVKINPHNAKAEGDIMGHCFARYKDDLWEGRRIGFSLRDPRNRPHVTFDVKPIVAKGVRHEDRDRSVRNVARNMARRELGAPEDDTTWDAKVEELAEQMLQEGRVPEFQVDQIQAKGNSAPPDRYRPWLAQFIEDSNFYCSSSQRRNLIPTDELLQEIEETVKLGDMIEILYSNVPPERRAEAIEIVYPQTEGWIDDIDEFGTLLSVLMDELKESPDNWNARDHLDDLLVENFGFFRDDDLDYLHKDLLKVMGGEKWLAGLLDSDDTATVAAGIHIVDNLRLDEKDPNWAVAMSNAAARTTMMEPEDNEMWAFKPDAFADPVERLREVGDSFHGKSWSNDYLYSDTDLGKRMHELYIDSPAEFERFISRIPYRFLDDWRGFHDTIPSDGGLFERPQALDSYPMREKMNHDIMRMIKEQVSRGERDEVSQGRYQPQLFQASSRGKLVRLANMLDEVSPSLSDRLESLL